MDEKEPGYDSSFEEEKQRYESDPWNYWGNPSSEWAKEERRRSSGKASDGAGPADEIGALRARLVAALRRQPADMRQLMRSAQTLSRMEAAAHRLSPDKEHELGGNMLRVLNSLNDPRILPPD